MTPYNRERLIQLVREHAVEFGDFTLASGQKSTFYIDLRKVTLSSAGSVVIGAGMLEMFAGESYDVVGGLTMGADPIVSAVLTLSQLAGKPIRGFLARKQAKGHGSGKLIEGPVWTGDRAIVVEDVSTTGASMMQAVEAAQQLGIQVVRVASVLDRKGGASELFAEKGIPFSSLLTLSDLGL